MLERTYRVIAVTPQKDKLLIITDSRARAQVFYRAFLAGGMYLDVGVECGNKSYSGNAVELMP